VDPDDVDADDDQVIPAVTVPRPPSFSLPAHSVASSIGDITDHDDAAPGGSPTRAVARLTAAGGGAASASFAAAAPSDVAAADGDAATSRRKSADARIERDRSPTSLDLIPPK